MFYDNYISLCKEKGLSPSKAAMEIGINKASVTNWKKNGYTPRSDILQKVADFFDVSTDYLLGTNEQKEKPPIVSDKELALNKKLVDCLIQLSPEEQEKVEAFVRGMIAARDANGN